MARRPPKLTPELKSDAITAIAGSVIVGSTPPELSVKAEAVETPKGKTVKVWGNASDAVKVQVFVDGDEVETESVADGGWTGQSSPVEPWTGREEEKGEPNPETSMVIVVATGKNGRSTGKMVFV